MYSAWHTGIDLINTDQMNSGSGQDDCRGNVDEKLMFKILMLNVLGEM